MHNRVLPPTPHARSGRTAIRATQHTAAAAHAGHPAPQRDDRAAAGDARSPGSASATHFWPSRSTPRPGTARTIASHRRQTRARWPSARAPRPRRRPAPAAARAARRRIAAGRPTATTAEQDDRRRPARKALSASRVPPRRSRCRRGRPGCPGCRGPVRRAPRTPRPPVGLRRRQRVAPAPTPPATAAPRARAATQRHRRAQPARPTRTGRRRSTPARPTAASISPVGVSPASAIQNTSAPTTGPRGSRCRATAAPPRATHGRQP